MSALPDRHYRWRAALGVICIGLAGGSILPMIGLIHGARFGLAA